MLPGARRMLEKLRAMLSWLRASLRIAIRTLGRCSREEERRGADFQRHTVHLPDLPAYAAIIRGVDRGGGTCTARDGAQVSEMTRLPHGVGRTSDSCPRYVLPGGS